MTEQQKYAVWRATVFVAGTILTAFGMGLSWAAILGTALMASAVPGMMRRRRIDDH